MRKDLPGAFGGCESAVVFSEKDERLDGIAKRAGGLLPDFQRFINFERLVVVFDSTQVIVRGKQSVGLGAQGERNLFLATQPARNEQSSFGKEQGLFGIDADFFHYQRSKPLDYFRAKQRFMTSEKFAASGFVLQRAQLRDQLGLGYLADGLGGHQRKPDLSSRRCRRSMHFCRVNPIDPTASPSSLATWE